MVFDVGGPYDDQTPNSVAKANRTGVISGTGSDLSGISKDEHVIIKCTSTGSGLIADHVYQSSADGTSWIDLSSTAAHTHSSTAEGGSLIDIYRSNSLFLDLALTRPNDLLKVRWVETTTTSGTGTDSVDGTTGERSILLASGATSGGAYSITYPHLQIDFSKRSMFQIKVRIVTLSNLALHCGVNADLVTAADSNTVKYDAEVCTTTNNNWHLRTASGSNKSMSDTGTAATTNRCGIRIEHFPDLGTPEADMYIDAATVFQKTSDIPVTGASADNNLITHSIKNSTAADRSYHMYASRLVYYVSDNWV
jgi:hypothetical protein